MSPLIRGIEEPAAVERADVLLPQQRAVHVVADHLADRAEDGDDVPAVGDRGGVGLARLRVPLGPRRAAEHLARPEFLAGVQVQRVHAPGVMRQVLHGRDVAVEAGAERGVLGARRGDGNHAIAPHDRAGGGQARESAVFQRMLRPVATSQSLTAPWPSAVPSALAPRNAGHGRAAVRGATGAVAASPTVPCRGRPEAGVSAGNCRGRGRVGETLALVAQLRGAARDRHPLDDAAAAGEGDDHLRRIDRPPAPLLERLQHQRRFAWRGQGERAASCRDGDGRAARRAQIAPFERGQGGGRHRDHGRQRRGGPGRCGLLHELGDRRRTLAFGECAGRGQGDAVRLVGRERRFDERLVARADAGHQRARGALRAARQQIQHHVGMTAAQREVDGARSVEGVGDVEIRAALDQQADDLEMPLVGGEAGRGHAVTRSRVDVHPAVQQRDDARPVTRASRFEQRLGVVTGRRLRQRAHHHQRHECEPDDRATWAARAGRRMLDPPRRPQYTRPCSAGGSGPSRAIVDRCPSRHSPGGSPCASVTCFRPRPCAAR